MINLLSDQHKSDIAAARANVFIVRYTIIIILALLFITGALYTSYTVLTFTMNSANERIASNDLKADVYSETKQEVDALSSKLSDAKSILDQEIQYSQVLVKIGQLMPVGTALGELTLTSGNFTGAPLDLIVYAKSTDEASQLQTSFQNSPLFSKVEIKSTSEIAAAEESETAIEGYPVAISMSVTLNKAGI